MPAADRLLWPTASITRVRCLARPSTSAALSPAAPPPTTTQSHSRSIPPRIRIILELANLESLIPADIDARGAARHQVRRPPERAGVGAAA